MKKQSVKKNIANLILFKSNIKLLFHALLVMAALITAACSNILAPPEGASSGGTGGGGTGRVLLRIEDGAAAAQSFLPESRSVIPAVGGLTYQWSLDGGTTETALTVSGGTASLEMAAGAHTITVTAYTGGAALLRGSAQVTVTAGDSASGVTINLTPVAGNGTLSYTVSVPGVTLTAADLTITPIAGTAGTVTVTGILSALNGTKTLAAGYYLVTVKLRNNTNETARDMDVVYIYPGQTSAINYSFTAVDFTAQSDIGGTLSIRLPAAATTVALRAYDAPTGGTAVETMAAGAGSPSGGVYPYSFSGLVPAEYGTIYLEADITVSGRTMSGYNARQPATLTVSDGQNLGNTNISLSQVNIYAVGPIGDPPTLGSLSIPAVGRAGETFAFSATAFSGSEVKLGHPKVNDGAVTVSGGSGSYSFTMPEANAEIQAEFVPEYVRLASPYGWTELQAAVSGASTGDVIVIENDIPFQSGDTSLSPAVDVTIIANGDRRIYYVSHTSPLISMSSNVTLTLGDPTVPGTLTIEGDITGLNGSLIIIDGNATMVMKNNVILKNNTTSSSSGGAVRINYGTFTMDGGTITGNTATGLNGGGVFVNNTNPSVFEMNGGEISGNTAAAGSGVYVATGEGFFWSGGTISGNNNDPQVSSDGGPLIGWDIGGANPFSSGIGPCPNNGDGIPVWSGDGLSANAPIAITHAGNSARGLAYIPTSGLNKHYYLAFDLTLGSTWTAMGKETTPFTGSLDGRRHTITVPPGGTTITPVMIHTGTPDFRGAGLFGLIDDASAIVENLTLAGGMLSANNTTVSSGDNFNVGGFAGILDHGTIQNCAVKVSISQTVPSGANGNIGGIAGNSVGNGTIQNCYSSGGITGNSGSYVYVGGIAGNNGNNIVNCYSTGAVSAAATTFAAAGGIAGDFGGGIVANCYSTGAVSANASSHYAGGIAGQCTGSSTILNSMALGPSITTPAGNNLNRICGTSGGSISNNYGRSDMLNGTSPGSWTLNTTTGRDGGDVSMGTGSGQANNHGWWMSPAGWTIGAEGDGNDSSPWEWDSDRTLPKLYWE